MCAEREPLDCHRCLLVTRALAERGLRIGHILHDGAVESHTATERRLLELSGKKQKKEAKQRERDAAKEPPAPTEPPPPEAEPKSDV